MTLLLGFLLVATGLLSIRVDTSETFPVVRLVFQTPPDTFRVFTLPKPPRLVLDFPGARYRPVFRQEIGKRGIKRIRGSTNRRRLRIVLDLARLSGYEVRRKADTVLILLQIPQAPSSAPPRPLYSSRGKRDPFQPPPAEPDTLFDPTRGRFTGVLYGPEGPIALVEDAEGRPFILREGSRVKRGVVAKIEEDRVIFALSHLGTVRRYVLKREKEVP